MVNLNLSTKSHMKYNNCRFSVDKSMVLFQLKKQNDIDILANMHRSWWNHECENKNIWIRSYKWWLAKNAIDFMVQTMRNIHVLAQYSHFEVWCCHKVLGSMLFLDWIGCSHASSFTRIDLFDKLNWHMHWPLHCAHALDLNQPNASVSIQNAFHPNVIQPIKSFLLICNWLLYICTMNEPHPLQLNQHHMHRS